MNKFTDAVLSFAAMICLLWVSIMLVVAYGGYPR